MRNAKGIFTVARASGLWAEADCVDASVPIIRVQAMRVERTMEARCEFFISILLLGDSLCPSRDTLTRFTPQVKFRHVSYYFRATSTVDAGAALLFADSVSLLC
jgi:hypothetical protein